MNPDLLQATRELSKKPWLFKLETPSQLTYAQRLREAEKVHGAIVLLPPWEIEIEGPFDIRNISKILGYGTGSHASSILARVGFSLACIPTRTILFTPRSRTSRSTISAPKSLDS